MTATEVGVESATTVGTGVLAEAGWIEGVGGVTEDVEIGDERTTAGDGVGTDAGVFGARDQGGR